MTPDRVPATAIERAWAAFVPRAIVGFMFFFAGADKLFAVGLSAYTARVAEDASIAALAPGWLIYCGALTVPFLEVTLGALLLLGVWIRPAARVLGGMVVLIAAAYGILGLAEPMGATAMHTAVINTYILPRAALIILVLLLPREDDLFSLEALRLRE